MIDNKSILLKKIMYNDNLDEHCTIKPSELLCKNSNRPKQNPNKLKQKYNQKHQKKYQKQGKLSINVVKMIKESLGDKKLILLKQLFKSRCQDLMIGQNQSNWQSFLKSYSNNNPSLDSLNLSQLNFSNNSISILNKIISLNPLFSINLTKNKLNPNLLNFKDNLQQIILKNCLLTNQPLQLLFQTLRHTKIKKIVLSSPQLRNRNQLTKYDELINLIKINKYLHTIELSNIQIKPNNGILQSCKNSSVKIIDLSKNTDVVGMCPTLQHINLSFNNITKPKQLIHSQCQITHLNISYNSIPYYLFGDFLKVVNFANLKQLILDKIKISGEVQVLQDFIEKSALTYLSLEDCSLRLESYQNICYAIIDHRYLRSINLSHNKLPNNNVAHLLAQILPCSNLRIFKMNSCDLSDQQGQILFHRLTGKTGQFNIKHLNCIEVEKNYLRSKTSIKLCEQLKINTSITKLNLNHNFIKYDQMKQINTYLQRNQHLVRVRVKKQYEQIRRNNQKYEQVMVKLKKIDEEVKEKMKNQEKLQTEYLQKRMTQNKQEIRKIKKQLQICIEKEQQMYDIMAQMGSSHLLSDKELIRAKKQANSKILTEEEEENSKNVSDHLKSQGFQNKSNPQEQNHHSNKQQTVNDNKLN